LDASTIAIADPERAKQYPKHGWATADRLGKTLWLPISRLLQRANEVRKAKGAVPKESLLDGSSFDDRLRDLARTLRELSKCQRLAVNLRELEAGVAIPLEYLTASDMLPLFVDLAYTTLRRLADDLARAARHVLFECSDSAPGELKKLAPRLANNDILALRPLCDMAILREAFAAHLGWFNSIRERTDAGGRQNKGVRGILEHHAHRLLTGLRRSGEEPWESYVQIHHPNEAWRQEILSPLPGLIEDVCGLFDGIVRSVTTPSDAYAVGVTPFGDYFHLWGEDVDVTKFWPAL
jgi:hypothetical protein